MSDITSKSTKVHELITKIQNANIIVRNIASSNMYIYKYCCQYYLSFSVVCSYFGNIKNSAEV